MQYDPADVPCQNHLEAEELLRTKAFNYEEALRQARRVVREAADRVERSGCGPETSSRHWRRSEP